MENIIFKAIVGSQAYGTSTPESDTDHKGIFMQPIDELITFGYKEQINVTKDECYYEVRRFLELLSVGNPTALELLYSPEDCIVERTKQFDLLIQHRDKFLTNKCLTSFGNYAIAQIKKAKGLDKKMNWEKTRIERKTPLDFVYAYENGKTMPIEQWLKEKGLNQKWCGLVALNHFKDCYALYHDHYAQIAEETLQYPELINKNYKKHIPLGYHGIVLDDSNDIRLSSVPKGLEPVAIINFNKDAYSNHCRDFKDYNDWIKNRNTQRYVDIAGHGQSIDGKNLLHTRRLLDTAIEIATQKTINVRRPNADYLLSIRRGEVPLNEIIEQAEKDIVGLEELFANSGLPKDVDKDFVNDLLLQIRKF